MAAWILLGLLRPFRIFLVLDVGSEPWQELALHASGLTLLYRIAPLATEGPATVVVVVVVVVVGAAVVEVAAAVVVVDALVVVVDALMVDCVVVVVVEGATVCR